MLAVPLAIDQPGNAARIQHHGLGLVANVRLTMTSEITAMLDALVHDGSFRRSVRALREKLQVVESNHVGADLIERVARSRCPSNVKLAEEELL
jgi:zeaxanthin glucosyltransferase